MHRVTALSIILMVLIIFYNVHRYIERYLLESPLDIKQISDKYGYRDKHPVLGHGAMHKGIDFRAPIGTPIYAAANGIISFIGEKSGYGNYVVISHSSRLSTAYGHISKFATHLKTGLAITQGEVIAYVGNTGRTTGSHLHFEVMVDGKQVNPMDFKTIWDD